MSSSFSLFICGILTLPFSQSIASMRDPIDCTITTKGELETWRYVDQHGDHGQETTSEVTLKGKVVLREKKVLGIRIAWQQPNMGGLPAQRVLLVVDQRFPSLCESLYRLADLKKSRRPYITSTFGNCHAEPVIKEVGGNLLLYFQSFNKNTEGAYIYSSKYGLKRVPVTAEIRALRKP